MFDMYYRKEVCTFRDITENSFRKTKYYLDYVGKNVHTFVIVPKIYHRVYQRRKIKKFVSPVGEFDED